jgi:hypothetical protein|tara:strand:+ start:638 stop:919 length:282 start_codon:yes stop_codon:yes gene_type:complete
MANTTKTYLSVISRDDKSKNKAAQEMTAKQAKLQLQRDLLDLEGNVASAESNVEKARYAEPYSSRNVLSAKINLVDAKTDLIALKEEEIFHAI